MSVPGLIVSATDERGEQYSLAVRQREPIYILTSRTVGVIARSDHLASFEDCAPLEVLLRLSIELTKLTRTLVTCAGCKAPYSRHAFELLTELEENPYSAGISVRICGECGTCVAAPRRES